MILILLVSLLILLPLILTSAFPHLLLISIYSGMGFLLMAGWAALVLTIIARRHRITEWRAARKLRKAMKKQKNQTKK